MSKIFTYLFIFLFLGYVSANEESKNINYENYEFIYLDNDYVQLLKDIHHQLVLKNKDCFYIETCSDIKTRKVGEMLYQKQASSLYTSIYKKTPRYPAKAKEKATEGYVIIKFDIAPDGTTNNHTVIKGKCIEKRQYPYKDCTLFNSAVLKAAKKLKYANSSAAIIKDVPHKFSFALEMNEYDSDKVYVNISSRKLDRSKTFINNKDWQSLQKLGESISDSYVKFYWLGLAAENLNKPELALKHFDSALKLGPDPVISTDVKRRILTLAYNLNVFSSYAEVCEITTTVYEDYMCGMNSLQIGDSISGTAFLVNAYRENSGNTRLDKILTDLIDSQRNWLKQDLASLQSSS